MQNEFFQCLPKLCIYPWNIQSSKDNSRVSKPSYVVNKKFPWNMHMLFSDFESTFLTSEKIIQSYQNRR